MKYVLILATLALASIPSLGQVQNVHSMDLIASPPPGPPSFPVVITDVQMNRSFAVNVSEGIGPFRAGTWYYYPPTVKLGDASALPDAKLAQTYVVYDVRGTWIKLYKDYDAWIDTSHMPGMWYRPVPQP